MASLQEVKLFWVGGSLTFTCLQFAVDRTEITHPFQQHEDSWKDVPKLLAGVLAADAS